MVWGNLADLYHDIGRYDDALDALDQVLRLDPEQKDMNIAYTIRGRVYMSMHNYPRAIEEYSRALVSEHDLDSWPRMAELYRVAGDSASAARTIQQGLMEMQKDTTVDMLLAMGDTARAKAKVPQMVRKQNSASQHYNAACMYSRMHMPDEALAALRKSLENGFRNFYHFAWDQDLDNIRDLPEFKAMMDEYKAKVKEEQAELKRLIETL
jgi:tetratricopeptide (TPR) repeat protein